MAEVNSMNVNGYTPHQPYTGMDGQQQYNNGAYSQTTTMPQQVSSGPINSTSTQPPGASGQPAEIPKDEVGWYFVEQYYTTLSRNPEKLYLFYNKRSQFVSGQETDKVPVCVGQRAINDKIKELDFQDCKVRVTNVDSQASDSNIVIQVIGEISNKSQPHKKFTQTFVLATQTNGYFVLNDIFRYIVEEEDETEQEASEEVQQAPAAESGYQEPAPTAETSEPKTLTSSADPAAVQRDAEAVDEELNKKILEPESKGEDVAPAAVNGTEEHEVEAPAAPEPQPEQPAPAVEQPKDEKSETPEPTPAASPPKQAPAQPAAPPKPAGPKTWASLAAAANRVATPTAPAAPTQPASQARAAPAAKPQTAAAPAGPASAAAPPSGPANQRDESPASTQQDEWTAVGGNHSRQQSRQTAAQPEGPQHRAYIKSVFESVDEKELKTHLEQFGELSYFDVSRQKNCAFVDFKTAEGYSAAVAANPHELGGGRLYVEERKPRGPGQAPFVPGQRGQFQGPRGGGRGGANPGAQRGAFQGGRGGNSFPPRGGRGGNASPRGGRGGAQAA